MTLRSRGAAWLAVAWLCLSSPFPAFASKSRDDARRLLKSGQYAAAVSAYGALALDSSADAELVGEYAFALAASGQADSALSQLDRAFALDAHDPAVLYYASRILDALGVKGPAAALARPAPGWLGGFSPNFGALDYDHELGGFAEELKRANLLLAGGRFVSAADRFSRLTKRYPSEALAWGGLSIALERIGAYKAAAAAARKYADLGGGDKTLINEHAAELESEPLLKSHPASALPQSLKGRYLAFFGGNWSRNDFATTVNVNTRWGKFFTDRFDAGIDVGYLHNSGSFYSSNGSFNGLTYGASGRFSQPMPFNSDLRATAGAQLAHEPGPGDQTAVIVTPGLACRIGSGEIDFYIDFDLTGPLKNTHALSLGYTHYFGGPK